MLIVSLIEKMGVSPASRKENICCWWSQYCPICNWSMWCRTWFWK